MLLSVSFFFITCAHTCVLAHFVPPIWPPPPVLATCRFRPMITVDYLQRELAFNEREDCIKFMEEKGLFLNEDKTKLNAKTSLEASQSLWAPLSSRSRHSDVSYFNGCCCIVQHYQEELRKVNEFRVRFAACSLCILWGWLSCWKEGEK